MVIEIHAIYQNNEWTSLEKKDVEPVEPVLKNIYQIPTEKRQKGQKDQQSSIFVFVAYLTIPSSN